MNDLVDRYLDSNGLSNPSIRKTGCAEGAWIYGHGGHIDGPGDWKPDPNAAKRTKEFIEKGVNADPVDDAIQDGDYHDLLDQNVGPEGF